EKSASLEDVADAAARLLGDGGRFAFVYPAQRLSEAMTALTLRRLEPKRLRLVQARLDARPSVFLMECVKSGRPGLVVEPALILRNVDGSDTDEARKIYHLGEE
ncbi:MAG: tRNA1(Val) (adenine(37)-N6)-methyltransferase, partial [Oscillospiraceae bacterium]|nr:tRNA1(Val) (adenine(37)-N6)-methyltransferase [Oscillospiraceae bacterium]